jgi:hypothetical protein
MKPEMSGRKFREELGSAQLGAKEISRLACVLRDSIGALLTPVHGARKKIKEMLETGSFCIAEDVN